MKTVRGDSDFFGKYQLLEEIHSGTVSTIWKAYDPSQNQIVALKILNDEFSYDPELVERFEREAKTAKSLEHPNIIKIYDIGCEGNRHYFTMDFINGPSVRKMLEKETILSVEKAATIVKMVCLGLYHAHCAQVIHRDMKPSNIMLDENGNVILLDFGIAKVMYLARLTRPGLLLGTPEYMSPEQIRGVPLDGRTDLYSAGIVLYELLTGTVPFKGENFIEIAEKIVKASPLKPSEYNKEIPGEMDELILKAIDKDRTRRFTTGLEMANAINRILGLPIEEIEEVKSPVLIKEKKKRPTAPSIPEKAPSISKGTKTLILGKEFWLPPVIAAGILLLFFGFLNPTLLPLLIPWTLILVSLVLLLVLTISKMSKPERYLTARLLLFSDDEIIQEFPLTQESVVIGRDQPEGIEIFKETVSRSHAVIRNEDGFFLVYDLSSTNGTFVNGRRIVKHLLKNGDRITVGGETLIFLGAKNRR